MFRADCAGWTIPGDGAKLGTRARYPSGKGEVCKTFMRRFDSDPRLQNLAEKNPHETAGFFIGLTGQPINKRSVEAYGLEC